MGLIFQAIGSWAWEVWEDIFVILIRNFLSKHSFVHSFSFWLFKINNRYAISISKFKYFSSAFSDIKSLLNVGRESSIGHSRSSNSSMSERQKIKRSLSRAAFQLFSSGFHAELELSVFRQVQSQSSFYFRLALIQLENTFEMFYFVIQLVWAILENADAAVVKPLWINQNSSGGTLFIFINF